MSGVSLEEKKSRRRRMKATAKAKVHRTAVLLDQARAKAAAALAPNPERVDAHVATARLAANPESAEPVTFTRRETGAQIRLSPTGSPATEDEGFLVECVTHHAGPEFFKSLNAASKAAQHSEQWCSQCDGLTLVKEKVRARERRQNKASA